MGTPIGRILLMPKGDYSGSAVYNALDWVRHAGSAWVCTTDNTTGVAPAVGVPEWQVMASDGSVGGWNSLSGKPFETLGAGVVKDGNDSLTLVVGETLLLGSKLDVVAQNTYSSSDTKPISGQGVAAAIADKAEDDDLDDFTTSLVAYADGTAVKVAFDNLNPNYGYKIFFDDKNQTWPSPLPSQLGDPVKSAGTTTGTIKLTYTLSNANAGSHYFSLRIFK